MGKQIPYDSIPDSMVLPIGDYVFQVEGPEEGASAAGNYMITVPMRAVEGPVTGMQHWERFAIGNANDPGADDPNTWNSSVAARQLKRLLKAAGVPADNDLEVLLQTLDGRQFGAAIGQQVDDGSRDPKYKGNIRNTITAFFAVGSRAVGGNGATKSVPLAVRPAIAKVAQTQVPAQPRVVPKATPAAMIKCQVCSQQIARSEFAAHITTCEPPE